jgi:putative ABC transport system permease protein
MNDLTLIRKNLLRDKLRAGLMIVSIMVAFMIFGVLAAVQRAFDAYEDVAATDRLIVVNKINSSLPMPVAYVDRIRGINGVKRVSFASWFGGYYQDPRNILLMFAVEPHTYMELYEDDFDFPPDARRAFVSDRTGAMVGETLANKWGWKVGDRVPIASNIFSQNNGSHTWDFTIAGIFKNRKPQRDTNFLVVQYDYFNETRSYAKDRIGYIILQTAAPSNGDQVVEAIDKMFANSSYETSTDTEKAFNKAWAAQFANVALVVKLIVGAAFLTILMIVGNTMVMAVRERTMEIAVLKTLGFSSGRVLRLVLGEAMLLALIGGGLGIGIAILVTRSVGNSLSNFFPGIAVTPTIMLIALAFILCLGIAAGTFPAISAFRLRITTALGRS